MRFRQSRHRNGASQVSQPIARLINQRIVGLAAFEVAVKAPGLRHKIRNHPVKYRAVVVTGIHQGEKTGDRERCAPSVELQHDVAFRGFEQHARVGRHIVLPQRYRPQSRQADKLR